MACDVCGEHEEVGVASVPGVPMSVAYCTECLRANAHPYGIMVINTALIDGYDNASEWWQQMVDDTLAHLGKTREQFDRDVEIEMKAMAEWEMPPMAEPAPRDPSDPF